MTILSRPFGRIASISWQFRRSYFSLLASAMLLAGALSAQAAIVRGIITDPLGAAVANARVQLILNGKVVGSTTTGLDCR